MLVEDKHKLCQHIYNKYNQKGCKGIPLQKYSSSVVSVNSPSTPTTMSLAFAVVTIGPK